MYSSARTFSLSLTVSQRRTRKFQNWSLEEAPWKCLYLKPSCNLISSVRFSEPATCPIQWTIAAVGQVRLIATSKNSTLLEVDQDIRCCWKNHTVNKWMSINVARKGTSHICPHIHSGESISCGPSEGSRIFTWTSTKMSKYLLLIQRNMKMPCQLRTKMPPKWRRLTIHVQHMANTCQPLIEVGFASERMRCCL